MGPATFELAVDSGDGATRSLMAVDAGKSELGKVLAGEGNGPEKGAGDGDVCRAEVDEMEGGIGSPGSGSVEVDEAIGSLS